MKKHKLLLMCLLALFIFPFGNLFSQNNPDKKFVNCSNYDDLIIRKKIAEDQTLYTKYRFYEDNLKQIIDNSQIYKQNKGLV